MTVQRISPALLQAQRRGTQRRHKYHATPVNVDGIRFASKAEAAEYTRLWALFQADQIASFELQPSFDLHAPNGVVVGRYVADFRVVNNDGEIRIIDVKGFLTPMYRWKKRHVEAEYGIEIEER